MNAATTTGATPTTGPTQATGPTQTTGTTPTAGPTQATGTPPTTGPTPTAVAAPVIEITAAQGEPRHRLHPVTPVLRGIRMLTIVIAIFSWQGYQTLGPLRWALGATGVLVVALVIALVSWLTTGYQVHGRELRISEGLLWRRTRAIPLERLQTVDVVRPLLARLAGVAELRLEVIGSYRAEAPLAYLSLPVASRLREHLLSLADGRDGDTTVRSSDERVVHRVRNGRVLLAQLLTPHTWFVPLGLVVALLPYQRQQAWNLVAVGSMLTAVLGVVLVPVRRIVDDWHFHIREDEAGLRLYHGLLGTRSQTVPRARIQAVGVTWPLMWRPLGWLHARMDVAGYGAYDREAGKHASVLLPVADLRTAHPVLGAVLGAELLAPPLVPAPRRARWLAPLRYRLLAVGHDGELVYARDGWLVRRLVVAPLARAQSVRVVQGPVQRLLRLADVHVDTAGRLHVLGEHRDVAEAYALAAALASAARAARAREMGAHHRSTSAATA